MEGVVRPARSSIPVRAQVPSGAPTHRHGAQTAGSRWQRTTASLWRRVRRASPRMLALVIFAIVVAALAAPSIFRSDKPAEAVTRGVGSVDLSYQAKGVKAPTGRKPEASKLWIHDGSWWGVLFDRSRDAYMIYRFDWEADEWIPNGQMVDDRNGSRADVLWDGRYLYAVSGGLDPASPKHRALLSRFSYDGARREFRLDRGFPLAISEGGAETFVVDKDGDGRLWVTFTRDRKVYVTHSLATDRDWTRPFPLPVPQATDLSPDDISALVAYDDGIGVMWSDQKDGAMYFASHPNGADDASWDFSTAIQGPGLADDHMNLKALRDDPAGRVFAVIKTSLNDAPEADPTGPLIMLLVLQADGTWDQYVVSRVVDDQTRPLLLIDQDHRQLIVFTSAPCCSGGRIYFKSSSLDRIKFSYGAGTPFMVAGADAKINNPTSTRQNLGSGTDLLVVASDDESNRYLHNVLYLRGPKVPPPSMAPDVVTAPSGSSAPGGSGGLPVVRATLFEDGFESGGFERWTTATGVGGGVVRAESGQGRSGAWGGHLLSTATKGATATARFRLPDALPALSVGLDVKFAGEGPEGGNAPILRLFDERGRRLVSVYRQNRRSDRVWVGQGDLHDPTSGRIDLQTWARVEVGLRPAAGGSVLEVRLDGRLVYQAPVAFDVSAVREVQIGNDSKGQPFDIFVDDVRIQG